jgi:hypothetical protein
VSHGLDTCQLYTRFLERDLDVCRQRGTRAVWKRASSVRDVFANALQCPHSDACGHPTADRDDEEERAQVISPGIDRLIRSDR